MQPGHALRPGGIQVCEDSNIVVPGDALVREIKLIGEAEDIPTGTERLSKHSSGHPAPTSEHSQNCPERAATILVRVSPSGPSRVSRTP